MSSVPLFSCFQWKALVSPTWMSVTTVEPPHFKCLLIFSNLRRVLSLMEAVCLGGYSSFPWARHLLLGTRKRWDARRLVTSGPHGVVYVFPLANWGTPVFLMPSTAGPPLITFSHLWSYSHCSCQRPLFQYPSRVIWHSENRRTVPCFINRMKAAEGMFNFAVKMPSSDSLWSIKSTRGGRVLLRILKP